ncbi:sulfotransferase 1C4-like [Ixodes scapularis]
MKLLEVFKGHYISLQRDNSGNSIEIYPRFSIYCGATFMSDIMEKPVYRDVGDLKVDAATWVMKIADFLGDDYGKKLRADERALENILSKTNFEAMKEQMNAAHENLFCEMSSMPEDIKPDWVKLSMNAVGDWVPKKNHKSFDFLRKGAVGDWTTHFSDEQVKRLKEHIELKTRGSNVMSLWKTIQLP